MPLITVTLEPNKVQGGGADGSQAFYSGADLHTELTERIPLG